MSNFEGDPKIFIDQEGSYLEFKDGQPVMDRGLENAALISLLTDVSWHGNAFLNNNSKQGGVFEKITEKPITSTALENIRRAADSALNRTFFGRRTITVSNPVNYRIDVDITIEPPGADTRRLKLEKNGENWILQNINPAHKR